jgi:hypothetical protein
VLATSLIRPELSGKRGLSCYFTAQFREQQNRQNPSLSFWIKKKNEQGQIIYIDG